MTDTAHGTFSWSSAHYTEREASTITVGTRVVLTGKDGQGTYSGLADVLELLTRDDERSSTILVTLWTGQRRIYRRWDRAWMIRVATPI